MTDSDKGSPQGNLSAQERIDKAAERMEALKAWAEKHNTKLAESASTSGSSTTAKSTRA